MVLTVALALGNSSTTKDSIERNSLAAVDSVTEVAESKERSPFQDGNQILSEAQTRGFSAP